MRKILITIIIFLFSVPISSQNNLRDKAETALLKGAEYFHSLSIHGGYVYYYSLQTGEKWGEGKTDSETIEVQMPGTPAVGYTFLNAYHATKNNMFLKYAEDAAMALVKGQNKFGGWDHKIHFNNPEKDQTVSFDDNQTQGAIRFLMAFNQTTKNNEVEKAISKALNMMLESQLELGGWPHHYPKQNNYHDYATFNDGGINDCIDVMIDAYKNYKNKEYLESIKKAARYIDRSQLPPPQSGWAQQYNEFLQPAWARTFEPPSVCPIVTVRNINSLMDIYLIAGDENILNPIHDAFLWLNIVRMPNGKYPRFAELVTNKPLYYDRGRIRVSSLEELSEERRTTYGYEQNLDDTIKHTFERYNKITSEERKKYIEELKLDESKKNINEDSILKLEEKIKHIIEAQDSQGRWISKKEKFKVKNDENIPWKGAYDNQDRISSELFNRNMNFISNYLMIKKIE